MARKTPQNRNLLSPTGFQLLIARMPNVEFFVQDVTIPGVEAPDVSQPNPLVQIKHQADQLTFSQLSVTLSLDEDLKTWEELFKWKLGLAFPNSSQEHKDLVDKKTLPPDGIFSDMTIIVETNQHNANLVFTFKDAFPLSISQFTFTSRSDSIRPLEFTVNFSYTSFSFERLKHGQ
jgi:hypothetical protein